MVRAALRKLSASEKRLYKLYEKVLTIARTEKAVAEGVSFDLMYVNGQYHRQYAFMRKAGSDVLLVIANFEDQSRRLGVTIPSHAFDFLELKEKNAQATELMTGEKLKLSLKRDVAVNIEVAPYGAAIIKFKA